MARIGGILKSLKLEYLDAQQSEGGFLKGYQHFVSERYLKNPSAFTSQIGPILAKACAKQWEQEPAPSEQLDLFMIGGVKIDQFIAFPDASVPGGYRKVLQVHANVGHLRDNWIESERVLEQHRQRSVAKQLAYEVAYARAGNDLLMPLKRLVDADEMPSVA